MKWNQLFSSSLAVTLCATGVLSTPFPAPKARDPAPGNDTHILTGDARFEACELAENCEVYVDPQHGKKMRFKKGMEPGTAAYNATIAKAGRLAARAEPYSVLNIGENVIVYGTQNPYDVVWVMWDACQAGGCGDQKIYKNTQRVAPTVANGYWGTEVHWYSMIVNSKGWYSTWDQRNRMIQSVLAACQVEQRWEKKYWQLYQYNGQNSYPAGNGELWEGSQVDYFQVGLYVTKGGAMLATLEVSVKSDYSVPTRAGCGLVKLMLGQLGGAISPILGGAVEVFTYLTGC
ncbi:hypothetical protein TWF281_007612 [Arthrobotrys megalospora]